MSRENFPVASLLVAPRARPPMRAFYAFARTADDVADDPATSPADKLARLARFAGGLDGAAGGEPVARDLRDTLLACGHRGALVHGHALLGAFRHDAVERRCADWPALLAYCRMSADPVGRFVLDIHGEGPETHAASDALCTALQVLNHIQDMGADWRELGRAYLPADWIAAHGGRAEDLGAGVMTPALRGATDRALACTGDLLETARALPGLVRDARLAAEIGVIVSLARRLHGRLRAGDPLARRIRPGPWDVTRATVSGIGGALLSRRSGAAAAGRP